MKKDTEMIIHRFPGDIIVYTVSDVHHGALEHNRAGWERLCQEILSQPNAYVILAGDLINNSTRSSVGAGIWTETARPREQKRYMAEALRPLAENGRILCILDGNHEARSVKENDEYVNLEIASKLGIEDLYRENAAYMAIQIGSRGDERDHPNNVYRFAVTHGASGGLYTGGVVNRAERASSICEGVDCFVLGHSHKGFITRPSKLVIDTRNGVVVQRDYLVVSCVSWMEYGGYAMQKMLTPAAHSVPQKLLLKNQPSHDKKIEVIW